MLADDSEIFRRALRRCFEGQSEIALVGEASDFAEAVRLAQQLRPDVVLLDLHLKDSDVLDALTVGRKLTSSGAIILAISFSYDDEAKDLAKQIGAVKLMDKMSLYRELIRRFLD